MSSVTRLYLIRHGATILTAEDRFAGETNVPLSDEGRAQAQSLGARLSAVELSAIYSSPMDRTLETSRYVLAGQCQSLPIQARDGLREISHGHWEQKTRAEVMQAYPDEILAWDRDPYTFAPPGGETGLAVTARALPVIMDICEKHQGQHVAIVTHKATIRLILSALLGFDPRRYRDTLDQAPCALNILDSRSPTCFRLSLLNDTSHYSLQTSSVAAVPISVDRLSPLWSSSVRDESADQP